MDIELTLEEAFDTILYNGQLPLVLVTEDEVGWRIFAIAPKNESVVRKILNPDTIERMRWYIGLAREMKEWADTHPSG